MALLAIQGAAALAQLGLVLLLGAGAMVWMGRVRRHSAGGRTIALTPQHAAHVVEVDGRRILLGTGPGGAPTFLCDLDASPPGDGRPTAPVDPAGPLEPVPRPVAPVEGRFDAAG